MVEAWPGAAFEVIEAKFIFEFAIILFHAPALAQIQLPT
jgi:hypothetical protein